MSQQIPGHVETFVTGADLSTYKNRFMKITADNTVGLATANTDPIIGVLYDIPYAAAAAQAAVMLSGTPMIMAGGAITAGARCTTTAAGKLVAATTGQNVHAIAIQAATADGDLIQCKLQNGYVT
jgi:hypothetical protein